MTERHHELAQLLFPHVTQTPDDWYAKYPPRKLPEGALVTRYAPSPTGFVHIGSIYASLISRRVAHQSGGVFFLRIEDTDKKREKDGSIEEIVRNLINFDLRPDEGVVSVDPEIEAGDYAPYTQSERVAIYETFAKFLIAKGLAYPAFDSEDELDDLRKNQEAQKVKPGYYGEFARWREASVEQVKARLDAGERPVIRVRAPYPTDARVRFHDKVKGDLDMPANDQDTVLLKSNSLPTYHFAHVVDDTLMRVNMVIRGDEWLPSAPLHLQLFDYIEQPAPMFAHISPIAKMDGTSKRKLSKRKDPEASMMYYYEAGYPVQAVEEYLLNLANSDFQDWRKANPTAPNSEFRVRLEEMGKSSPLFDIVKLNDISKDVVATYTAEQVYAYALTWAKQYHPKLAQVLETQRDYALRVFNVERTTPAPRKDIVNWSDVERALGFFFDELFYDHVSAHGYPMPSVGKEAITTVINYCRTFDLSTPKETWLANMREFAEQNGFARDAKTYKQDPTRYKGHFGDMMMVLRVALTGKTNTPDLYEIMQTMGQARVEQRLSYAVEHYADAPTLV